MRRGGNRWLACWGESKPAAKRLPLVPYTAREVRSGLLFLAFAQRRSAAASSVFAARLQRHLVWQTDNGSEFVGGHDQAGRPTGFPSTLGDSQHVRIPPAAHTYQSDVETPHRLVEEEFFDLERFRSRSEFLAKATLYQPYTVFAIGVDRSAIGPGILIWLSS